VRSHKPNTPTVQSRHPRPRQQVQARTPRAHLRGQSAALTYRPGRSPLRGCHPHARRVQTCSQTRSVDAHAEEARVTASSTARDWRAMLGRASPIDDGTTTPLSLSRPTPSPHPTRASRAEVSSPPEAIQTRRHHGPWPWTGAPHRGARPSPSRVTTSQRRTMARRHRGLAVPRHTSPSNLTTFVFKHQDTIATTRERRNHPHCHTGNTRGGRRAHQPSLSAKGEAPRRIPWIAREVRGSVAEIVVGPRTL